MTRLDDLLALRDAIDDEIAHELVLRDAPNGTGALVTAAAALYSVSVADVLSGSRDSNAVRARHAACWLLRQRGLSLPHIGRVLDRNHTTVLHACRQVDARPAVQAMLRPLLTARVAA